MRAMSRGNLLFGQQFRVKKNRVGNIDIVSGEKKDKKKIFGMILLYRDDFALIEESIVVRKGFHSAFRCSSIQPLIN